MASHSTIVTPMIIKASFKDILAEEANFTPSHQSRYVKFVNMIDWGLTSTPCNLQQEVAVPTKPTFISHLEEIWLHVATCEFRKISNLKGGYTRLVFQSWLDICDHVQDRRLMEREAIQLVKDFTTEQAQDEMEFYMGMVAQEDQSLEGIIDHLHDAFQSGEMLSELISNFYSQSQKVQETEDTFADDFQVFASKIITQ